MIFNEWLRLEENDMSWFDEIDKQCPCTLFDDADGWSPPRPVSQKFHPGGTWERRKDAPSSGSGLMPGSQCVYDAQGRLMTASPSAGTADRYAPSSVGGVIQHFRHDVVPFNGAADLGRIDDYNRVRPLMGGVCCTD